MDIIEEAYNALFPDKEWKYESRLKYSGKFSDYNANVKQRGHELEFGLSREWRHVSKEIKIGLLQTLMLKLFRPKTGNKVLYKTTNIDLYNMFLKNLHVSVAKDDVDSFLSERFDLLNDEYFHGMLDKPNLVWGKASTRRLGSYEYGTDTILLSEVLREARQELLDYVLYHEMLHKKMKFKHSNQKSFYHTKDFKAKEKQFPNAKELEKDLSKLCSRKRFFDFF